VVGEALTTFRERIAARDGPDEAWLVAAVGLTPYQRHLLQMRIHYDPGLPDPTPWRRLTTERAVRAYVQEWEADGRPTDASILDRIEAEIVAEYDISDRRTLRGALAAQAPDVPRIKPVGKSRGR